MSVNVHQNDAEHVIQALRLGTVPQRGLQLYSVGNEREYAVLQDELQTVVSGHSRLKAIRGGYGSGKTFITSRLAEDALAARFVVSRVSLNRDGYSLHRLESFYQGVMQQLRVKGTEGNALASILDRWMDAAEEYVIDVQGVPEQPVAGLQAAVRARMEVLLKDTVQERPSFAAALAGYYEAHLHMDHERKRQALGWLMADPHASTRPLRGVRGYIEGTDVFAYLQEFVRIIRQMGRPGLVIIVDELDEMRHLVRRDMRARAWASLRDLIDRLGSNVEGVYVVLAATPDVLRGPRSIEELPPLAQRLSEPTADSAHPNLRGAQLPLQPFTEAQLGDVLRRVRLLWERAVGEPSRLPQGFEDHLARGWTERLGARSPRIAIREFIAVLDRLHDYATYDPLTEYDFDLPAEVFTPEERGDVWLAPEDMF